MNIFNNKKELENIGYIPDDSLINADCFDVFPYIKDKSIDAIICDLPYG
jgi:DNA modification methylase